MAGETQQAQQVQSWIAEGRTVCPFATLADRAGAIRYVQLRPFRRPAQVWRQLRAFIEREEQALVFVLPPPDPPTWAGAQAVVTALFEEILLGMNRVNFPAQSIRTLQAALDRDRQEAEQQDLRRQPFLLGRGVLFSIGMGPQYPADHPRYAPHTLVQCTWQGDVAHARAKSPALQRRIEERLIASVGGIYDADELWLDVAPAVAPRRPRFQEDDDRG